LCQHPRFVCMAGRKKKAGARRKSAGRRKGGAVKAIRGRGDYQVANPGRERVGVLSRLDKVLRRIPRGAFASAGGAMGGRYGGPIGNRLGRMAGAGLSAISGYGNYNVSSNSLSTVSASMDMVPQFVKQEHSIRIKHREFIRDLLVPSNPSAFSLKDYVINPGNRDLFPWLGQMARQYSQYKIHGMVFAFKTMSSDYAASGPLGTVFMATNYNALDRPFDNKIELENTEFAVSTKPSLSLVHAIECDPKVSGFDILYIRDPTYDTGETSDRRFYDYGRFQVGTQGLPGEPGSTLGELWVTYDIELIKPIVGGTFVSGTTLISRADGTVGVGYNNDECDVNVTMPTINPAVSTAYNVVPTNAGTLSGDVGLWGTVFNTSSTGFIKFLKNGIFRIHIGGYGSTGPTNTPGPNLNATTGTVLNPVMVVAGRAWYNAANKEASPSTVTPLGGLIVPYITTNTALNNAPLYNGYFEVRVFGIQDNGVNDYVTLSLPSFTTSASNLIANYVRAMNVSWTAFGMNEQTTAYIDYPAF